MDHGLNLAINSRSVPIADRGSGFDWLFWLMVVIIIAIIIFFVFVSRNGLPSNTWTMHNKDKSDSLNELEMVDRLERNFLAWITMASIFLAAAIIIKGFERYSVYYSIVFFIIVILLLIITNADYLTEKRKLEELGINVFPRLDYLFLIVTLVIFVNIFIIYDILKNDERLHPGGGKSDS